MAPAAGAGDAARVSVQKALGEPATATTACRTPALSTTFQLFTSYVPVTGSLKVTLTFGLLWESWPRAAVTMDGASSTSTVSVRLDGGAETAAPLASVPAHVTVGW